jgi:hypothetical protein
LNCDRDPARWAREFNEAAATQRYPYDEGFLIGWFANAMMCGEDTYRWRQEAKARSETHPTTQLPMGDPHPCDMTPDEREKFFACTDDKPLQPLKVRTKFLGQGDLYDLYLGDTYLGRFGLDAVVPLANAITNAVSVHPSTPTDKSSLEGTMTIVEVLGHPDRPVAAPCAISGCQYSSATRPTIEKELLDKCIMAVSGQYTNDDDGDMGKECWNSAVAYCIGALLVIQEQLAAAYSRGDRG